MDNICPKCVNGIREIKMHKKTYKALWVGKNSSDTYETGNDPVKSSHIYVCPECGYMEIYADVNGSRQKKGVADND